MVPSGPIEGLRDHLRIFAAITERDPEKARSAMRAHLENAERNFLIARSAGSLPAAENRTGAEIS
jgi:DNA-binding FadR family transcriptional regulator